MAEKRLLLGDEAIALGAIHAGISGVYAYPGTPSTEITEFIQIISWHRKEICIVRGVRMRRRQWRLPWACLMQASVLWSA